MKDHAFYRVWGKYYGFPSCCVESMIEFCDKNPEKGYAWEVKRNKFSGSGFVPCDKCDRKPALITKFRIAHNRICPSKFPHTLGFSLDFKEIQRSVKFTEQEKQILAEAYRGKKLWML